MTSYASGFFCQEILNKNLATSQEILNAAKILCVHAVSLNSE